MQYSEAKLLIAYTSIYLMLKSEKTLAKASKYIQNNLLKIAQTKEG